MAAPATTAPERRGLTTPEAAARLRRDGPNVLPVPRPPSPALLLVRQMTHFFALLLWAAAGLAFLGGLPQLAVAIVIVVLVNGVFAFVQEYRADRAGRRLRELLPARVIVRRDGRRIMVDAADLVTGDIVLLGAGDRVSADLELLDVHSLALDESMLTGESVPVHPDPGGRAHAGTFVVEGEAETRVAATGGRTRLAGIAALTRQAHRRPSPLTLQLRRVRTSRAASAENVPGSFTSSGSSIVALARSRRLVMTGTGISLRTSVRRRTPGWPGRSTCSSIREPAVPRLRFVTSHPWDLSDRLIEAMRDSPSVCEHLHLPVQSGDDLVLRRMGRQYTIGHYLARLEAIRAAVPGIALSTDVIVGFCGETEAAFEATLRTVERAGITKVHVFPYSPRPGTRTAGVDAVPPQAKKERSARLRALSHELCLRRWRGKLGGEDVVLVDRPGRGYGDDYSPWLVDAPVGELVRVPGAAVTEEGIRAA